MDATLSRASLALASQDPGTSHKRLTEHRIESTKTEVKTEQPSTGTRRACSSFLLFLLLVTNTIIIPYYNIYYYNIIYNVIIICLLPTSWHKISVTIACSDRIGRDNGSVFIDKIEMLSCSS